MPNRWEQMWQAQYELQQQIPPLGRTPYDLRGEERIQFFKDQILALENELHAEVLGEMGWKPWATSRHFNREAVAHELIDVFHFFLNLCMAAEMGPAEFYRLYMEKNEINRRRQTNGYDGVEGKCKDCGRALDDPQTLCTAEVHAEAQ